MKTFVVLIAFFFGSILAFGQGVTIGTNNPPDPSAALDLQSTSKGFLHPRMTTSQRNAIVSPASGLQIFNTTTNCLEVYLPLSGWKVVACDCQSGPSSAFTFPNQIGQGIPATFTATTPGMNYAWTFQSGTPASSTQQTENVTWAVAGTYTVTLTVTDNAGCSSTTTQSITVTTCPPFGSNSVIFTYTGGLQTFTVPNTCAGIIRILALGAQGGNSSTEGSRVGGLGASIQGDFVVTPGQTITLLVGGKGTDGGCGGGGGGGSFAVSNGNLMIAAGGGGGAMICNYNSSVGGDGFPGLTTQNGGNGGAGNCYNNGYAAPIGGINGLGGGLGSSGYGGGGGGYLGAGSSGNSGGGGAYPGAGGTGGSPGGYGGGGAGYSGCCGSAGGGGGYSGGAGGNECSPGGGGGSFNVGTNPVDQQGIQSGNGQIVITY